MKHNVIIVDDDKVILEVVSEILNQEGFSPHKFVDVASAEKYLDNNPASLLLLDVSMPNENGYSFLKRLKENLKFKELPVIFMTGKSAIDDKVQGFELGAVDYVIKPFHRMDLLMRVKTHIKIIESQSEDKEKLGRLKEAHRALMPLPKDLPEAKFAVYFNSLLEAGGDFYVVLKVDDNNYAYFVADISGHDIATSYIMPAVIALLKQCFKGGDLFHDELLVFNRSVKESIPAGKFITGIIVLMNRLDESVVMINMGHLPPVIMNAAGQSRLIEVEGDILGVHENPMFGFTSTKLNKGDRLILYTDGLLENPTKRQIWPEALTSLPAHINDLVDKDLRDIPAALVAKLNAKEVVADDVLVLAVEL